MAVLIGRAELVDTRVKKYPPAEFLAANFAQQSARSRSSKNDFESLILRTLGFTCLYVRICYTYTFVQLIGESWFFISKLGIIRDYRINLARTNSLFCAREEIKISK